ncbi:DUF2812 domain-containing protein [Lysinibacillus sp. SGAir0095]|uniref:DUF2812 domain-containing protein n=1 Tax=Lysinibacillus sp. SGAir0095 TaxID=2070463 RepID=UPI0010CD3EE8|nr:DUF2812 domain-containing protein [Lysinibacillus sp. SGAir0095]QCR32633.1 hypothetical protein C1N55_10830 [Lysinibacillus sp. SGAir0095]
MKETKIKLRLFFDYEKEEKWVNHMAEKGWHLTTFGIGYYAFKKGDPGEYIYRNEMIYELGSKDDRKEYIDFLQLSGIELVKVVFNWAYFRKKASEGPFELYSDTSSKLAYLNRVFYLFSSVFFINVLIGIVNTTLLSDESKNSINDFVGGLNIGIATIILFPLLKVINKRRNLKQKLEIFND